jgi:2-polyprenyl-3-methyl-5-hydroxy-6-metoxy-1,4-benzoquinol methylase
MTSKIDPSSDVFNNFYSQEDPWGIIESIPNLARQEILNSKFQNCQFQNGLDLGCGEGNLTVSMKFVNNFDAIDISKVALSRAKKKYPQINFQELDIRDLSSILNNKYDFISCFETLYYISQDNERERILIDIKNKGKDNCLYLFSIVTVGENKYRKYFTYSEGINFFKKHFQIIDCFPITIGKINLNFFQKFIRKILKFIFTKKETIKSYKKLLNRSNPEDAYQCIFILIKN